MTQHIDGQILTTHGWIAGEIRFDSHIRTINPKPTSASNRLILPGFVDLHVHGGGGFDCMDGADSTLSMARFHAQHGTTSLLATTVTAPKDRIIDAFDGIRAAINAGGTHGAAILGAHLEGPFINPDALGAQPPFAIPPDLEFARKLHAIAPIKIATIAPEIDPDHRLLQALTAWGCRCQIGHSKADAQTALSALDAGAVGFTHLYNAMSGLHHREPGCVGAALAHAKHAEIILDFHHVDPVAARAALRAIPNMIGITDAVSAAGMPHGRYRLGEHTIITDGETARLKDGTLAGSILTMDRVFQNLLELGLDAADASLRTATFPARYLGLTDRGTLAEGFRADIVALGTDGAVDQVFIAGQQAG